jgi:hypothetical protein
VKKTIFMLALSLGIGIASFANNDETINQKAEQSFKKEFAQAKDVRWQKSGELVKVTFTWNEKVMFAYYSETGELVAITRNITTDQLPITLLTSLKKVYSEYWISDLFEMVSGGLTTYYITVENADHKLVLKSDDLAGWSTYLKEKKVAQ